MASKRPKRGAKASRPASVKSGSETRRSKTEKGPASAKAAISRVRDTAVLKSGKLAFKHISLQGAVAGSPKTRGPQRTG